VLDRTVWNDEGGLAYQPGFNDDFLTFSATGSGEQALEKVLAAGGKCVRINVDWGSVQASGPRSYDWTAFDALHGQSLAAGVQILPSIHGCPDWADPVYSGREPGEPPPYPEYFRTCSPEHDPDFGRFADATLRHFDAPTRAGQDIPTVISAVEILNEPNIVTFGEVPANRLFALSQAAAEAVSASQAAGAFSGPMTVVSGGLAPVIAVEPGNEGGFTPRPSWQDYLRELVGSGTPGFDVGVHSYETSKPPPGTLTEPERNEADPYARAGQFAEWQTSRIVGRVDQALDITDRDVWVTETGASSAGIWSKDIFTPGYRQAHGQRIQADVLSGVADALKSRPRIKAMVVHRLFDDDAAEPAPSPTADSIHFQSGVYDSADGKAKLAVAALAEAWS